VDLTTLLATTLKLRSRHAPGVRDEYQTATFDRGKLTLDLVGVSQQETN